jgi:hypothetical protein
MTPQQEAMIQVYRDCHINHDINIEHDDEFVMLTDSDTGESFIIHPNGRYESEGS